jgi:antitoxin component of MazEF toxin-antitoxin module
LGNRVTIKKLTKLGNSQALVIDKQTLAQMGLSEASEVSMTLHGRQLVITPVEPRISDEELRDSMERVLDKYDDLFRRLA